MRFSSKYMIFLLFLRKESFADRWEKQYSVIIEFKGAAIMGYIESIRKKLGHDCLILPGSAVIVSNEKGEILLQQRDYPKGKWCFPGGLMELAESTEQTAVREVWEETGLKVSDLKLMGVYSGPEYLCHAANGDEWYVVTTVYTTSQFEGVAEVHDQESLNVAGFDPRNTPDTLVKTHQKILKDYIEQYC